MVSRDGFETLPFKLRSFFSLLFLLMTPALLFSQPDTEWISRYNGPGNSYDIVANMGSDAAGIFMFTEAVTIPLHCSILH
ncbi:MAG: hypothetical protein R3A12_16240 [Ignavibacteria bacterium]